MIEYHLSFNTISDSADGKHPDVEVIDYRYGASGHSGTIANREMASLGETFKQDNVTITIPQMEFLYFKWRILASGEICEERVDLSTSLPKELKELYLHFIMRGSQLHVFLIDRR
ncbi:hypothetical protein [Methylotenera sp. G11]|uniref:hypothetical protein n=1 Tax=Methylotenera sp. G11 TaxID=1506585 RepID=UPI0006471A31|nr:hypothetical protein [Methylotenera sp. G11]